MVAGSPVPLLTKHPGSGAIDPLDATFQTEDKLKQRSPVS